ncbi:hypothetical protein D3C73_1449800 [compost metagenome]
MVHDDAVGGHLFTDVSECFHDRQPQALVDLCGGEVVRDLEVEGRGHHSGGNGQAQEPLELGGHSVVRLEKLLHSGPDRDVGLGR